MIYYLTLSFEPFHLLDDPVSPLSNRGATPHEQPNGEVLVDLHVVTSVSETPM
jgi:hypothetical protein